MTLAPGDRPALWRLARIQYDDVRQRPVLLYPEGVVLLNDSGGAILALCDGVRTIDEIAFELRAQSGEEVYADVVEFLDALIERGLVRVSIAEAGSAGAGSPGAGSPETGSPGPRPAA